MLRNRLYYHIKPIVPQPARMAIRRWFALRKREQVRDTWPIMPGSERPPAGWSGWPGGKQFALVLTHDVEGQAGLDKTCQLMELEMKLGFHSAFNFVPENGAAIPPALRDQLTAKGFEVGVHDLHHDGKLFSSRREFARSAVRINRYLKEWGAVGFRSAFMLHNLDWLHDLNIQYDCSTFDTDPFEPQPQGEHTIFPFWVPGPLGSNTPTKGYVELPYTLPQDSTLFLLHRERHPDVWIQKIDWVARHGGMVLLNTHPDYMAANEARQGEWEYPAAYYEEFLQYVRSRYSGAYWQALPKEVAAWVRSSGLVRSSSSPMSAARKPIRPAPKPKIWIDLDNTPHVPFFEPILEELKSRGYPLLVTARDAFQVCDLADKKRLSYLKVGRHNGKNRLLKAAGLAYRAMQLAPVVLPQKPALGISHGARSQLLLGTWARIPTVLIEDYEHCQFPPMMRPTWLMTPAVIPNSALGHDKRRLVKYPGIKEDVYAWKLDPDVHVLEELGLGKSDLIVTVRPPATEAHYHNPESELLFEAFMDRVAGMPGARIVLLPRNKKQAQFIRQRWPQWFESAKTVIPSAALDGMNLIWHSDLVVSGGGTMNREAAALRVPVYSIFRGEIGAVDRHLETEGRLVLIKSVEDVHRKIQLVKRERQALAEVTSRGTLHAIVDAIEAIAEELAR